MYKNYKELDVNKSTQLNDDYCEKESIIRNNQKMHQYHQYQGQSSTSMNNQNYLNSLNTHGMYQGKSRDGSGLYVDKDSSMRNGKNGNILTSTKSKSSKILDTSQHLNTPFLGSGESVLKHPDLKSKLLSGEDTYMPKSCDTLSGISIDRFTPLVPCLKENVQDTKHIVPEYWVRGGMSTRNIIRNIDYMRTCGIRK
jgi:hypothetical protein